MSLFSYLSRFISSFPCFFPSPPFSLAFSLCLSILIPIHNPHCPSPQLCSPPEMANLAPALNLSPPQKNRHFLPTRRLPPVAPRQHTDPICGTRKMNSVMMSCQTRPLQACLLHPQGVRGIHGSNSGGRLLRRRGGLCRGVSHWQDSRDRSVCLAGWHRNIELVTGGENVLGRLSQEGVWLVGVGASGLPDTRA